MPISQPEDLKVREIGLLTFVGFSSKRILDQHFLHLINEEICRFEEKPGCKKMILDLENIEYISSADLGSLIILRKKIMNVGGYLSFCNVASQIREVFEITMLEKVFSIEDNPDERDPVDSIRNILGSIK
jgi:anti-sigma B factor antagonist